VAKRLSGRSNSKLGRDLSHTSVSVETLSYTVPLTWRVVPRQYSIDWYQASFSALVGTSNLLFDPSRHL